MIVVCIKVGDKYTADYVNRLQSMVARHLKTRHKFICLTDNPVGLKCSWAPIDTDLPGWWAKLVLFKPHKVLTERFIYLDLDTVIVDSIDFIARYQGPFCILHDFWAPTYNSSVIAMVPGCKQWIWEKFNIKDNNYNGDQDWITTQVPDADLWQNFAPGRIGSYKADALQHSVGDYHLVCFHGEPKPHQIKNGWVYENWH